MLIKMRKMIKREKGFTLIELIVVVAVLGILATIAIPRVANITGDAEQATLKMNQNQIQNAVERYNAEKGSLPDSFDDLKEYLGNYDELASKYNVTIDSDGRVTITKKQQ